MTTQPTQGRPELWHADGCAVISTGGNVTMVAHTSIGGNCRAMQESTAARIAAAANFCKGFPTEALTDGGLANLVNAVAEALSTLGPNGYIPDIGLVRTRRLQSALSLLSPKKEGE